MLHDSRERRRLPDEPDEEAALYALPTRGVRTPPSNEGASQTDGGRKASSRREATPSPTEDAMSSES
ncbi:hypothetical protein KXX35_009383, partial [Aspergillus fumigatus]